MKNCTKHKHKHKKIKNDSSLHEALEEVNRGSIKVDLEEYQNTLKNNRKTLKNKQIETD